MSQPFADPIYGGAEEPVHSFSIQDYISTVLRGKWIILITFGIIFLGMVIYTIATKPIYESTSLVLVNIRGGGSYSMSEATRSPADNKIANELGQLKSRTMAEFVARKILQNPYLDRENKELAPIVLTKNSRGDSVRMLTSDATVASRAQRAMDFSPERESDVIRITGRSSDPREAALLANTYAEVYQEYDISSSRARTRSRREFLQSQLNAKQHALDSAETALKGYMQTSGVVSLDAQATRVTQQLSQLEASRDAIDIDLTSLNGTLATYQQRLPEQEKEVSRVMTQANDPYIKLIQGQLADLQVQRDVLTNPNVAGIGKEVYTEKLKTIEEQIANLQKKLDDRTARYLQTLPPGELGAAQSDPAGYLVQAKQKIFETQMQIQALQAKKVALGNVIRQYESDFSGIPRKSIDLAKLQRIRMSAEKLYLLVEQQYNEAAIGEKSDFGYVDVIDNAVPSSVPVSPNLIFNLFIGVFFGFGLGLVIVLVREYLDVRINTPEDLKRHGYNLLAFVSTIGPRTNGVISKKLPPPSKVRYEEKEYDHTLVSLLIPFSPQAESFRRLRSRIEFAVPEDRCRKIVFTSPDPGEGKTTTVANLAISLTQAERKVLIVDCDVRKPRMHSLFNLNNTYGLCDILTGRKTVQQALHKDVIPGLDLVCAGNLSPKDGEILGSKHMKKFLAEVGTGYDWVVMDSSPVLAVSDAATLAAMGDGAVMIVSGGSTRMAALDSAIGLLGGIGGRVLGVFLNNFDAREAYGGFYGSDKYGYFNTSYGGRDPQSHKEAKSPLI